MRLLPRAAARPKVIPAVVVGAVAMAVTVSIDIVLQQTETAVMAVVRVVASCASYCDDSTCTSTARRLRRQVHTMTEALLCREGSCICWRRPSHDDGTACRCVCSVRARAARVARASGRRV